MPKFDNSDITVSIPLSLIQKSIQIVNKKTIIKPKSLQFKIFAIVGHDACIKNLSIINVLDQTPLEN